MKAMIELELAWRTPRARPLPGFGCARPLQCILGYGRRGESRRQARTVGAHGRHAVRARPHGSEAGPVEARAGGAKKARAGDVRKRDDQPAYPRHAGMRHAGHAPEVERCHR